MFRLRFLMLGMMLTLAFEFALGHTWGEQLLNVASNGTFIGEPGYIRGNVLRNITGFSDDDMVWLLPPNSQVNDATQPLNTSLAMCRPSQSTQNNQTEYSPRLISSPGSTIAIQYQENGHVTQPWNQPGKPANRGTVFIYGTNQPRDNELLSDIHGVWNANGTGGDKRGRLVSTQNFDDGRCYEIYNDPAASNISNARQAEFPHVAVNPMGANLWCQNNLMIPQDVATNEPYTLYWVWDWPTAPGAPGLPNGKYEIYTSCMDIDIVASANTTSEVVGASANRYVEGQDIDFAAIPDQFNDAANPTRVPTTFPSPWNLLGKGAVVSTGASYVVTATSASGISPAMVTSTSASASGTSATELATTLSDLTVPVAVVTVTETVYTTVVETDAVQPISFSTVTVTASEATATAVAAATSLAVNKHRRHPHGAIFGKSIQAIPVTSNYSSLDSESYRTIDPITIVPVNVTTLADGTIVPVATTTLIPSSFAPSTISTKPSFILTFSKSLVSKSSEGASHPGTAIGGLPSSGIPAHSTTSSGARMSSVSLYTSASNLTTMTNSFALTRTSTVTITVTATLTFFSSP